MLIGALVATAGCVLFRLGLVSFDYQARVLVRKGIDPEVMPDRRMGVLSTRVAMWFFAALAAVLWGLTLLTAVF